MKNELLNTDAIDYCDDAHRTGIINEHDVEMAGSAVMVDEAKSTSEHSASPREFSQAYSGYSQASIFISFDLIFCSMTICVIFNLFMTYYVY